MQNIVTAQARSTAVKPQITLRHATKADISVLAEIDAAVFIDDPLDISLYPGRYTYRSAYTAFYRHNLTINFYEDFIWLIVAEVNYKIVGFATWGRNTKDLGKKPCEKASLLKKLGQPPFEMPVQSSTVRSWLRKQIVKLRGSTVGDSTYLALNPATSLLASRRFKRALEADGCFKYDLTDFPEHWKDKDAEDDCWYLHELGILPECQGQGIGKALLSYGMTLAEKEGLPVLLSSSMAGRKLYTGRGFEKYGSWMVPSKTGKQDEMWMMWWKPPGYVPPPLPTKKLESKKC